MGVSYPMNNAKDTITEKITNFDLLLHKKDETLHVSWTVWLER